MEKAYKIAESVRYSYDKHEEVLDRGRNAEMRVSAYHNWGLKVSPEMTPKIYENLEKVCNRLGVNIEKINAFVLNRSTLNAHCVDFGADKGCIIALHSKLINMMTPEEVQFIIGHEIGHFLFHHNYFDSDPEVTLEESAKSRAGEISADRIGLLGCNDIDAAIHTIIRMQSGLTDEFLNKDLIAYLKQMENEKDYRIHLSKDTHPSSRIRVKALMRFAASNLYRGITNKEEIIMQASSGSIVDQNGDDIDAQIKADLDGYFEEKKHPEGELRRYN